MAAFIGGTGYQYGDTELLEFNERLYLEFARQLRAGTGTRSIGMALRDAKREYLKNTPVPRDIHEKSVLQTALFGLPMFQVDLPFNRGALLARPPQVSSPASYQDDPGKTLGLKRALVEFDATELALEEKSVPITVYPATDDPPFSANATYLKGADGQFSNPLEPVLPLAIANVSVDGMVLRGAGFEGGTYSDQAEVLQLTGAPATEIRGVSLPFQTTVFYPVQPWAINYYDAVCNDEGGDTHLMVFPAQYLSGAENRGTRRAFNSMNFRLFYSANTTDYGGSIPALSDAPTISSVTGEVLPGGTAVRFSVVAVGNPAAGIQEVWVTYADTSSLAPAWTSFDLEQNSTDSRIWEKTLTGVTPANLQYMVQAVNGVGLVTLDTKRGAYYVPATFPPATTTLTLDNPPLTGAYANTVAFSAVLATGGAPLADRTIEFVLDAQRATALTDSSGRAAVPMMLLTLPGNYELTVTFAGTSSELPTTTTTPFKISKKATTLNLEVLSPAPNLNLQATLTDAAGQPLSEKSVFFVLTDASSQVQYAEPVITDFAGRAQLGAIPLPPSTYTVAAYFNGIVPLDGPVSLPAVSTVLIDARYEPSSASGGFTYVAQRAAIEYLGEVASTDGTLHLSAKVTASGDLTLALVEYVLLDANNQMLISTIAPVAKDGLSVASFSGLPPGSYQVMVTVVGGAYTSPTVTGNITVGVADKLNELLQFTQGLGLPRGRANSLVPKLQAAIDAVAKGSNKVACGTLKAFAKEVEAQAGRDIPAAQAKQLIDRTSQIQTLLQCS